VGRSRNGARRGARTTVAALAFVAGCCVAIADQGVGATAVARPTNATIQSRPMSVNAPVVGMAATPTGRGFWRAASDGGVLTAGDAQFYGSAVGIRHARIVAIVATPTGHGYWLVDRRGAVFSYGDARFRGSTGAISLHEPIVGMAATASGNGYWLVAADGGIFAFNAPFHGSTGAIRLNQPIVGMAAAPGGGYWLVASDGGVFAFGAAFYGSTGAIRLNRPIVGMATAIGGRGYTMVAADGGLFRFGANSPFFGSAAGACPGAPAVAVATSPGAIGYWIAFADARTYAFSPSTHPPACAPKPVSKTAEMELDLLVRVNQERAARGIAPVSWDPALAGYAESWSGNMAANGFRHSAIANLLGPYNFVGENIAAGSAGTLEGALHVAWMHSDGHRANILAPGFSRIGIGVFCKSDGSIWMTEDFGHPSSAGPALTSVPLPPVYPIARPDYGTLHC